MYGKTEVLDETCSQTFLRKLKQNLNNFVPKIRVIYQNEKTAKVLIFYKKRFFREGMVTQPESSKNKRHRSHFEELAI